MNIIKHRYRELILHCSIIYFMLNLYICVYAYMFNLYIWFLYILALLQLFYANCLLLAILKLLEEMGYAILGMIRLTSHHVTNDK